MARPKKIIEPLPAGMPLGVDLLMNSADIVSMRDNIITGLQNLETGVHELRRAYIQHWNSRLPQGHPAQVSFQVSFGPFFPLVQGGPGPEIEPPGIRAETPGRTLVAENGPTKKKRKPHDPNAPKRALTSYFLFMQHNKPLIKESNPEWTAAQISAESEKQWHEITDDDRAEYDYMYAVDLCRYYKQKEYYESGEPFPEISADEAKALYDEQMKTGLPLKGRKGIKMPVKPGQSSTQAEAETTATSSEDEDDEDSPAPAPPPKLERASKRQKIAKDQAITNSHPTAIKPKSSVENPAVESTKVADKRKKGSKKRGAADDVTDELLESSPIKGTESGKKEKKTRKKRKSEAIDE